MSKARIHYETIVEVDLDLNNIKTYLLATGWVDDGVWGPYCNIYFNDKCRDRHGRIPIKLLNTDKVADFDRAINEVIQTLAKYENRSVPSMLESLYANYGSVEAK